jgi:hypothetical protein
LEAQPAHEESDVSLRVFSRVTRATSLLRICDLRFAIWDFAFVHTPQTRPEERCRPFVTMRSGNAAALSSVDSAPELSFSLFIFVAQRKGWRS